MKYIPLTTVDPGTFSYEAGQTLYNERLAHEILKHAAAMADEGYEIAFEEADTFDYTNLWNAQNFALSALSSALSAYENIEEFEGFYGYYASQLTELAALQYSKENYALRSAAILAIAAFVGGNAGSATFEIPQPLQIEKIYPSFPTALWNQQTAAIEEQSIFLNRIKENLNAKLEQLPTEATSQSVIGEFVSNLLEDWADGSFTFGLKYLLSWLMGVGGFATAVLGFLCTIGFLALKDLWDRYTQGVATCEALIAENTEALAISITSYDENPSPIWEYYKLRETVITRHQRDIHNLLTEIIALEQRTAESIGQPTSDMSDLIQAVQDLSMEGYEIEAEDFKIRKLGRTLTTGSW